MKKNLKGIMGVLLSAMLFAGTAAASPVMAGTSANILVKSVENASDGAVTYIYGDVDLNNKLEAVDALAVLKHVVKLTPFDGELVLELADTDHDTSITAADALAVLKCVVGLQTPSYYTVTPPASETPPATESGEPTSPALSESVTPPETPTPDVTETPAPSAPAETVVPTATPDVTETPDVTVQPTETVVPTATPDVTVQPTETIEPTDTPTPSESAEPTPTPDVTVEPTATPKPTVKPTDTPKPTETPAPTVTPTETPAPHVHNYTSEVTLEATCGKDGVETFTCECGDTFTKPIPATGEHTYEKTEEQEWVVDEAAYDEEIITQTPVWVCYGCEPETYFYTPEEVNAHRESYDGSIYHSTVEYNVTSISSNGWTIGPITTRETVHHDEVGHYEDIYKCSVCGAVKETETPDPATCAHTYERTEKKVWVIDVETHDEKVTHSKWICSCGEVFYTLEALEKHQFSMWDADIPGHGWDSVGSYTCHDHYEEVGHYETEVTYTCSICGAVREYGDTDTCTHEWYVAREAWNEYDEECHLFCKCGYDCGLYDKTHKISADENAEVYANFNSHLALYDKATMLANHSNATYDTVTATCPHDAIYRCALCGECKDVD